MHAMKYSVGTVEFAFEDYYQYEICLNQQVAMTGFHRGNEKETKSEAKRVVKKLNARVKAMQGGRR